DQVAFADVKAGADLRAVRQFIDADGRLAAAGVGREDQRIRVFRQLDGVEHQLQQIAGFGAFAFNTMYKLIWLKECHPQLLAQAHAWLFISSLINHRLTGEFTTDLTMAGTSQMLDLRQRDFSAPILQAT
ncbi:hypothetical protein JTL93_36350, partial [Pseudomonas aeruginosa]|nr:hypothetical protein [Pseudomonas aeruginosa]